MTLVTMAATYVLTPFIIHSLGSAGYGTWILIASITGYINLLALGVPMACVRYLAAHVAAGDVRQMNKVIGSCAGLYLLIGAGAVVLGGCWPPRSGCTTSRPGFTSTPAWPTG